MAHKGDGGGDERDRVRRAAEMLLAGATLLGHPCPYCGGVRVIKDGDALCVSCGQEPERRDVPVAASQNGGSDAVDYEGAKKPGAQRQGRRQRHNLIDVLEKKLESLAGELESETDRQREIAILDSIEGALSALEKARGITDGGGGGDSSSGDNSGAGTV